LAEDNVGVTMPEITVDQIIQEKTAVLNPSFLSSMPSSTIWATKSNSSKTWRRSASKKDAEGEFHSSSFLDGITNGEYLYCAFEPSKEPCTVSKNVTKGVGTVLVLVGAVLACVANEIGYFCPGFDA